MRKLGVALAIMVLLTGPAVRTTRLGSDQHRGGGELLWRCGAATRRHGCHRHQRSEQPGRGSASFRGQPSDGAQPVGGHRSWSTMGPITIRGWQSCWPPRVDKPQGHYRGQPRAQEARRQSPFLVRPADDANYAEALAAALAERDPAHRTDYDQRLQAAFLTSLRPWRRRLPTCAARFAGIAVTATEPVFGYMATALGLKMRNERFQLAVMNNTEPRASDVAAFENDLRKHQSACCSTTARPAMPQRSAWSRLPSSREYRSSA